MRLYELFVNKSEFEEGDVVDISTPMPAEFINWLKTKNLTIGVLNDRAKMRELRIQYEKETGRKINEEETSYAQVLKMYATNQKMLKKVQKAKQLAQIQTWDQAIDYAQTMPDSAVSDYELKGPSMKGDADIFVAPKTRGAQIGNQNARKFTPSSGDSGDRYNPAKALGDVVDQNRGAQFVKDIGSGGLRFKGSGAEKRSRYTK